MAEVQTDLSGVVAIFAKLGEHTPESVHQAVLVRGYDCAWVRVARARTGPDQPPGILRIDILDVDAGAPIRDDALLADLSAGGKTVVLVIFGEVLTWADGHMLEGERAALRCRDALGVPPPSLATLEEPENEAPLSFAFAHGRLLRSGPVPPPPFFYRFRDRGLGMGPADHGEPPGEDADDGDEDRAVLFVCDLAAARQLYLERPATLALATLDQAVQGAPPQARLGPFAHLLPQLRQSLVGAADKPAGSADADGSLFEPLLTLQGYGMSAGEAVSYLDERFFPVLGLQPAATLPPLQDELEDIDEAGILSAMVEVLPYHIPEGSVLQALDDAELRPAAAAAGLPVGQGADGAVEAAVFVVNTERLLAILRAFDPGQLSALVERFARHWYEALGGAKTGATFEAWVQGRAQRDHGELDRFLMMLNDLDAVLDTANRNGMQVALTFYAAE
jgi:hypothetical protein